MAEKTESIAPPASSTQQTTTNKTSTSQVSSQTSISTSSSSSATIVFYSKKATTAKLATVIAPLNHKTVNIDLKLADKIRSNQAAYLNQMRAKGVIKHVRPFSSKTSQQELNAEIAWVHELIQRQLQQVGQSNFWRATFRTILKDNDPFENPIFLRVNHFSAENFLDNYQNFSQTQSEVSLDPLRKILFKIDSQGTIQLLGINSQQRLLELENNVPASGWYQIGQGNFYYNQTGTLLKGWQTIGLKKYYFEPTAGKLQTGIRTINQKTYFFDFQTGAMQTGWQKLGKGMIYTDNQGQLQTGWQTINGDHYFFSQQTGFMLTGFAEFQLANATYYFAPDGKQVFGPQTINQHDYLFDQKTGKMKTGLHYLPEKRKIVFYDNTGKMVYQQSAAEFAAKHTQQI
ncbi:MAG: hypothetical protein ABF804_08825 [Liquorilactobacillus ghanensis]|uniref:N-acetylmuramoyl-L-alanine amidase family protein n=1 Tax=Liquorilactobacillus ghanensis TaxID=399370 RepID=UPI0039EB3A63